MRIVGRLLLTMLLTFSLLGLVCGAAVWGMVRNSDVCVQVMQEQNLAEDVYAQLEKDFSEAYHTTAIPAAVCMDPITPEWLEQEMTARIGDSFLRMQAQEPERSTDYSALEASMTAFFEEYAKQEQYTMDDAFYEKLQERIDAAEKTIETRMDVFYLDTLYREGYFVGGRLLVSLLKWSVIGLGILCVVLVVALVLLERRNGWQRLYWSAVGMLSAGALLTAPCWYLRQSHAIAGFSIKDPAVYHAVTGLLEQRLELVLMQSLVLLGTGVLLILLCTFCDRRKISE